MWTRRRRRGIQPAGGHSGRAVRHSVRRGVGVRGLAGGVDRFGVDSDRRAFDQHPARVRPLDDPRKQHRADDRLGRRIGGSGRDLHDAGADFSGVFAEHRILADLFAGADGRLAGRAVHDSAAAAADREGARQPDVSRRHGMRGRAGGRRARRVVCRPRVLGAGPRRRLHVLHEHARPVAGQPDYQPKWLPGASIRADDHVGVSGSGIHYRAARGGNSFRGRSDFRGS